MITSHRERAGAVKERCCLHIGMPKTGTKLLQMQLFSRHSQIEFLGTYIGSHRQYDQCRDAQIQELLDELIWSKRDRPNLSRCQQLFQSSVAPAFEQGRLPVWSWESMMEDCDAVRRRRAENLKAVFGDCQVIVGLRHPLRLVESLYLQLLKRDNVGRRASFRRGVQYRPIDQWLEKYWDRPGYPPTAHLQYADTVEIFADVFGRESVGIFLFEELVESPAGYIDSISRFLGIESEEAIIHTKNRRENDRWTQPQLDRLKEIKESLYQSWMFRIAKKKKRRQLLGINDKAVGPKARVAMSDEWKRRILDQTRAGNRRLTQTWDVPLEKFGYPV